MPILFVYGTLKKGYHNHHLLKKSKFLGEHSTEPIYNLFDGMFPIVTRNGETSIKGELYEVQIEDVFSINRLEGFISKGHKDNWYDIDVIDTPFGEARIFVMNNCNRSTKIPNGVWEQNDLDEIQIRTLYN